MTSKSLIQQTISDLVDRYDIGSQGYLMQLLKENGIDIPQSTLSRYLRRLNIVKVGNYYELYTKKMYIPVLGVRYSLPNIIVVVTLPGYAQALGFEIDKATNDSESCDCFKEIVGTLAGDDTLMVLCKDEKHLHELLEEFENNWVE